jgi:hypothetical protein
VRAEVVVPVGHAGVDDRDADAGAVEAERVADPVAPIGRAGALERPVDAAVEADAATPGARERVERVSGTSATWPADGERRADGAAKPRMRVRRREPRRRLQADDDARVPAGRAGALRSSRSSLRVTSRAAARRRPRGASAARIAPRREDVEPFRRVPVDTTAEGAARAIRLPVTSS